MEFKQVWRSRNAGRSIEMQRDFASKWYLSSEGYYFKYRADKYDSNIIRATLFKISDDSIVDDVRVSAHPEFNLRHKSHHDLINYFEIKVSEKK